MKNDLSTMEKFTIEDFQKNFDEIMERVENGETFMIESEYGNAIILPYKEVIDICQSSVDDFEEIVRIHTEHEEGS